MEKALINVEPIDLYFLKPTKLLNKYDEEKLLTNHKEIIFNFDHKILSKLQYIKNNYKISPFWYGQIIFAILVNKYTSQNIFAIGYPSLVDDNTSLLYASNINTNVFYCCIDFNTTLSDLINQTRNFILTLKNKQENWRYPIYDILQESIPNLLSVYFVQTNFKNTKFNFKGVEVISINHDFNIDISSTLVFEQDHKNVCNYKVRYLKNKVDEKILKNFIGHFQDLFLKVLNNITNDDNTINLNNLNKKIIQYEVLNKKQYNQIVYEWNCTDKKYPQSNTIHQLFEESVIKNLNKIAIIHKDIQLTYKEVNIKANQLAHYLKDTYQIKVGNIIAMILDRSEYMIIAMLATLKSGAAYLPIDPSYPIERIKYMIKDTKSRIILTNTTYIKNLKLHFADKVDEVLSIDSENIQNILTNQNIHNPCVKMINTDLAYIIYTSGTTGNPKGVMVKHKGVINLIFNQINIFFKDNQIKKCLWYSNYVFDAHVWEIYAPIVSGTKLYIVPENIRLNMKELNDYINKNKIELGLIPPSLLNSSIIFNLNFLILAGDKTEPNIMDMYIANGVKVFNAYGPTETTVCATYNKYDKNGSNNIGNPLANYKVYILDKYQKPLPVGAIGELYIAGDGVANGYINNKVLTEEKFINNYFISDKKINKMYKSGDLVRWLPNGNIEYYGRSDSQIKINGCRIELGEIEQQLVLYPGIHQVVAQIRDLSNDNHILEHHIVAYYIADNPIEEVKLINYLKSNLISYMIPNFFVHLTKMPITINGKIDSKALSNIKIFNDNEYIAPTNQFEIAVCDAFALVLNLNKIGLNDDFFKLGGSSIKAIKLLSILQKSFQISLSDIFELRTSKKIANKLILNDNFILRKLDYIKDSYVTKLQNQLNFSHDSKEELHKEYYNNNFINLNQIKPINNILLTGVTGFLGCNILNQLLKNSNYNIFVFTRNKNNLEAKDYLRKKYKFYFNQDLIPFFNRIYIITGDLEKENLDLPAKDYKNLINNIDSIIHCAALVIHYGKFERFYSANVKATINLLNLSKLTKLKDFHYISTASVLTFNKVTGKVVYTENDFPDNLSECKNLYIKTKFLGEQETIKYREYGVNSNIYRVGNLAFMLDNYCLQENIQDNAFFYWLKCILHLKYITQDISIVEISPADLTAKAIIKLFDKENLQNSIHHVFNPYKTNLIDCFNYYQELKVKEVSFNQFIDQLKLSLENDSHSDLISRFLLKQLWLDDEINYSTFDDVSVLQNKTQDILNKLDFNWLDINHKIFKKFIINNQNKIFKE